MPDEQWIYRVSGDRNHSFDGREVHSYIESRLLLIRDISIFNTLSRRNGTLSKLL